MAYCEPRIGDSGWNVESAWLEILLKCDFEEHSGGIETDLPQ